MSGSISTSPSSRSKRVLIVVANPSVSPRTGWPVGFWWSELTHPFLAFQEAGYEVEIRSPDGGPLRPDGFSDPEDPSGYSASDFVSLGFKRSPAHAALLADTRSIEGLDPADWDAIFVAGGQSPMITFPTHEALKALVVRFFEAGRITALVCHATCLLLTARLSTGKLLVDGRTWTGFADAEEAYADAFVGQRIQPFWIETEARKLEGTNFIVDQMFRPFAVRDGNLITGQQQFSGAEAARRVIEAVGR